MNENYCVAKLNGWYEHFDHLTDALICALDEISHGTNVGELSVWISQDNELTELVWSGHISYGGTTS